MTARYCLNPFFIRAFIPSKAEPYYGNPCLNPFFIRAFIPSRTMTGLTKSSLNPFFIRAFIPSSRRRWNILRHQVLIPSSSGHSFHLKCIRCYRHPAVLIPSSSGHSFHHLSSSQCSIGRSGRLNPFFIRAFIPSLYRYQYT